MANSGERAVELTEYLNILRRRWLTLVIIALTALALASAVTLAMPKKYTATTRLFIAVAGGQSATDLAQGSNFTAKQISSYAEVATSPLVLTPVITRLGLGTTPKELAESVSATVPVAETVILEIAATDRDPARAAQIADAIGQELSNAADVLTPPKEDGTKAVQATTIARAQVPDKPSSPKIVRNLGIGLILGLLLGLGVAVLRHVLDTKVRNENDVRALTDSPILGVVAYDQEVSSHPVILRDQPLAAPSEAVRRLRTNLQFIDIANRPKSIVISSSIPGEGKSTIAINLAVSLADSGSRVILVDADLRRPSVAEYLSIEGGVGLTTVLIGRAVVKDVVQPLGSSSLDLLPAGQIPPNPSELLGSMAMADLLEQLSASYDMVLLDSPPLLPVTDAVVLSNLAGGALVVVGADRIHRPQLQQSLESLETAGAHLFGIVMNKIARREAAAYAYGYGYGYGYGSEYPSAISEPKRSTSVEARRRRDLDDTFTSGQLPPNGHKSQGGRVPPNDHKAKTGQVRQTGTRWEAGHTR
jgi:succinoglycan biosynthesis transport protein ExoP